jgi:hypothetical protein
VKYRRCSIRYLPELKKRPKTGQVTRGRVISCRQRLIPRRTRDERQNRTPLAAFVFFFGPTQKGVRPLDAIIVPIATCTLTTLLVCLALVREVRLRRALQKLLARLLNHWRNIHAEDPLAPPK